MKKLDIHNHILPENWPDLKEVSIFQLCLEQETNNVFNFKIMQLYAAKAMHLNR